MKKLKKNWVLLSAHYGATNDGCITKWERLDILLDTRTGKTKDIATTECGKDIPLWWRHD